MGRAVVCTPPCRGPLLRGFNHPPRPQRPRYVGPNILVIQPDPQNPNGYVIARGDVQAVEQSKTSDPMYAIWSQALETRPNSVVEAIVPGAVTFSFGC